MPMDQKQVETIAELSVRRYFDHFLSDTLPRVMKAERHHTHMLIEAHDAEDTAHGGVERRFSRMVWVAIGLAFGGGGLVGGGVAQAVRML